MNKVHNVPLPLVSLFSFFAKSANEAALQWSLLSNSGAAS